MTRMRDAIANVVLFTVFALHHSIMARTGAKAWITRLLPPDLERSVYVWIASAAVPRRVLDVAAVARRDLADARPRASRSTSRRRSASP